MEGRSTTGVSWRASHFSFSGMYTGLVGCSWRLSALCVFRVCGLALGRMADCTSEMRLGEKYVEVGPEPWAVLSPHLFVTAVFANPLALHFHRVAWRVVLVGDGPGRSGAVAVVTILTLHECAQQHPRLS